MGAESFAGRPAPLARGAGGAGSTGAFPCVAAAWRAHGGELRGYLRHRVADVEVAEDLLQEVFVKAMRQGSNFCVLENPRAWLFQVTRNALVDRLRSTHPQVSLSDELAESSLPEPETTAPVDALAGCLARTLGELAPEDAAILRACDIDGQTQRAYALAHDLSLPATKSRLLRARRRLRERLTKVCQVQFEPDGSVCGHVPRPAPPEPEPHA